MVAKRVCFARGTDLVQKNMQRETVALVLVRTAFVMRESDNMLVYKRLERFHTEHTLAWWNATRRKCWSCHWTRAWRGSKL